MLYAAIALALLLGLGVVAFVLFGLSLDDIGGRWVLVPVILACLVLGRAGSRGRGRRV